ncbi:MAG: prepilin-type N-terminal cleavage/methylation domain-containing protein [Desulfocapsaceae bacterium]|nr:prepilin-type N-terminal cleavage/methylation domain-containing protein [Desulfocapsaceae bacterium]
MKNKAGFSLVEILITMAIMATVIALTGPVYNRILTGVKGSAIQGQVYHDLIRSMELIRLDIEHVGLGIGRNVTTMPIIWSEANKTLTLHSVLNNTNQTTMGWALLNCDVTLKPIATAYIVNLKETPGLQSMVLLDANKNFASLASSANVNCPATLGIYTAYPYDNTAANGCTTGTVTGFCNRVTYAPSATNGVPTKKASCAQGTFNLLRRVGTAVAGGDNAINCVADFRVRFDIDNNGNGVIDGGESELNAVPSPATAGDLTDKVKNVEFLILVQAGQLDDTLNSSLNPSAVSGVNLSLAGVPNASNYRWKVLKISGKPMSW